MSKKNQPAENVEDQEAPAAATPDPFACACDQIAIAVKKFTDAGMGGSDAGKLALEIFQATAQK